MLEFTRKVTDTKTEPDGPGDVGSYHRKVEYTFDGYPLNIYIRNDGYSVKGTNIELRIPFVKPVGPTVVGETSEYTITSKNGSDIDDIAFCNFYTVKQIVGVRHYFDKFPEQELVTIPENSSALGCLGITTPVHDKDTGAFLWFWCQPLVDYLKTKQEGSSDAEQSGSVS